MAKIRSIQKIAEKWATITPQRATDYQEGVKDPKKDWAEEAVKADARYREAVTKAATEGRYAKGVNAAGTKRWRGTLRIACKTCLSVMSLFSSW